jgi:hypothetical protein
MSLLWAAKRTLPPSNIPIFRDIPRDIPDIPAIPGTPITAAESSPGFIFFSTTIVPVL